MGAGQGMQCIAPHAAGHEKGAVYLGVWGRGCIDAPGQVRRGRRARTSGLGSSMGRRSWGRACRPIGGEAGNADADDGNDWLVNANDWQTGILPDCLAALMYAWCGGVDCHV